MGSAKPTRDDSAHAGEALARAAEALSHGHALEVLALATPSGAPLAAAALEHAAHCLDPEGGVDLAEIQVDDAPPHTMAIVHARAGLDPRARAALVAQAVGACVGVASSTCSSSVTAADLAAVACEGLRLALCDGRPGAVHSELYDLMALTSAHRTFACSPVGTSPVPGSVQPTVEEERASTRRPSTAATEADDPFAHGPLEVHTLSPAMGTIPPALPSPPATRNTLQEFEALRAEVETLRRERDQVRRSDAQVRTLLERRIAKVTRQLEETEAELDRVRGRDHSDEGVPSNFRTVQGLDPQDPKGPEKRELLEGVFERNRESRSELESGDPS